MVWIRRLVEVRLMAAHTGRRQRRVVIVQVALGTLNSRMRAGEWERRVAVIEACKRPRAGVVTLSATCREP